MSETPEKTPEQLQAEKIAAKVMTYHPATCPCQTCTNVRAAVRGEYRPSWSTEKLDRITERVRKPWLR